MKSTINTCIILIIIIFVSSLLLAADSGNKEEAVEMVKKAAQFIQTNGNEKAFDEFSNLDGKFIDRDL